MKHIYRLCLVVGLLLAIGAAGGSDMGSLSFVKAVWYALGGLSLFVIGVVGLKDVKEPEGE